MRYTKLGKDLSVHAARGWQAVIIIIIIVDIYTAQVCKGHKCAVGRDGSTVIKTVKQKCLQLSSESLLREVT